MPAELSADKTQLHAFVLEVVSAAEATYRRIGMAKSGNEVEINIMRKPMDVDRYVPSMSFEDGKHTIRVM